MPLVHYQRCGLNDQSLILIVAIKPSIMSRSATVRSGSVSFDQRQITQVSKGTYSFHSL